MSLSITTIEELQQFAQGKLVELPGWEDDKPFVARLKRPSMQVMVANGQIPNALLGAATKVFFGKANKDEDISMKDMTEVQMAVIKASLAEPTLEQLEEIGLGLTDEQLVAIFQYSQLGVKGLEQFRKKQTDTKDNKPKQNVSGKAK